jgi:hypothetical protein
MNPLKASLYGSASAATGYIEKHGNGFLRRLA